MRVHLQARGRRGQSLVEFALALTVILIFLIGIIDWGIAMLFHQTIQQRAAQAARYASIYGLGATAEAMNIVLTGAADGSGGFTPYGLNAGQINISEAVFADGGVFTGVAVNRTHVRVVVTGYSYRQLTPFVGRLINTAPIEAAHPKECESANCADVSAP